MSEISVVVPVYKVENYLSRCIDSILHQTYSDFQLILVDDGSPDHCPAICDEYEKKDSRIHVIHQENGGLSAARNAGIDWIFAHNKTEWITFIDSDDWVHSQYLEGLYEAVLNTGNEIAMCQVKVTNQVEAEDLLTTRATSVLTEEAYEDVSLDPNSSCARLFRTELFRDIRFPVGKLHEDRFTTYQLLFQFSTVAVIKKDLYFYFENQCGITRSVWTPRKMDNLKAAEEQIAFFLKHGIQRAYLYTLRDYIHLLVFFIKSSQSSYPQHCNEMRNRLRQTLRQHGKELGMSISSDFNTYKYAYPFRTKVYRRIKQMVGGKL